MSSVPSKPPDGINPESADLIDFQKIRDYVGFVLGAIRRRKLLMAVLFSMVLAATLALIWAFPRTYHVETVILAQRNQVISSLSNPNRPMMFDADHPTRAAVEQVMRQDNLVSLVKQTDLLNTWEKSRAPLLRVKDRVMSAMRKPPTEEEKIDIFVEMLEKKLVTYTGEGTVFISADWQDAATAFRLVEQAQQNFIESRRVLETSTIADALAILEAHLSTTEQAVEDAREEVQRIQSRGGRTATASGSAPAPVRAPVRKPEPDAAEPDSTTAEARAALAQIESLIAAKSRAIGDLEAYRQRRLAELNAQLVEQRTIYADAHPIIINTLSSIQSMQRESPQLQTLKAERADLEKEYQQIKGGVSPARTAIRRALSASTGPVAVSASGRSPEDEEELQYALSRLRLALDKHDNLLSRIDAAHIELETTQASFKYRYQIIRPPQMPRAPVKPKVNMLLAAGVIAGMAFAVFGAVAADIRAGRIVQRWQVERLLELPVLSELPRP